ncbi:MAG TPA: hypothetical protein VMB81_26045 [Candidatus Sulfotelmatobacter sp.]|nr:hypothetical protein [Candidatus Sulfotelmatobacter sp.]
MTDRQTLLQRLEVGDIFHAGTAEDHSLICLVMVVTDSSIEVRTVTNNVRLTFDRRTGVAHWGETAARCVIDSVAPLSREMHAVMLGLDRKMRLEQDPERFKLDEAEKRALIFVDSYYRDNPV